MEDMKNTISALSQICDAASRHVIVEPALRGHMVGAVASVHATNMAILNATVTAPRGDRTQTGAALLILHASKRILQ